MYTNKTKLSSVCKHANYQSVPNYESMCSYVIEEDKTLCKINRLRVLHTRIPTETQKAYNSECETFLVLHPIYGVS